MRPSRFFAIVFSIVLTACSQRANYQKPDDPLEAGRDFIRFALDGDMKMAKTFVLSNADNDRLFDKIEKVYKDASAADKDQYKQASIIINKVEKVDDTTTVINFANSFRKKNQDLKMVKTKGEWWVDFKYTFTGNQPLE